MKSSSAAVRIRADAHPQWQRHPRVGAGLASPPPFSRPHAVGHAGHHFLPPMGKAFTAFHPPDTPGSGAAEKSVGGNDSLPPAFPDWRATPQDTEWVWTPGGRGYRGGVLPNRPFARLTGHFLGPSSVSSDRLTRQARFLFLLGRLAQTPVPEQERVSARDRTPEPPHIDWCETLRPRPQGTPRRNLVNLDAYCTRQGCTLANSCGKTNLGRGGAQQGLHRQAGKTPLLLQHGNKTLTTKDNGRGTRVTRCFGFDVVGNIPHSSKCNSCK